MSYKFVSTLCDAEYIGYTVAVFFIFADICKQIMISANRSLNLAKILTVLKTYQGKMDCFMYETLLIKKNNSRLNIHSISIHAKVFI